MRLANLDGRLSIIDDRGAIDVESVSDGIFDSNPQAIYERWEEFTEWQEANAHLIASNVSQPFDHAKLAAPVPAPRQVFAIGLNYRDHAEEAGLPLPEGDPVIFAKYTSSVTGPGTSVELPSDAVDFEAELVVVIGQRAHRVQRAEGWAHVAGLTLGQDLSERLVQFRGSPPQFSLGKSYPGFSPVGPMVVTPEEFADRDNIRLGCTLNGEQMQQGYTENLVFTVPELIESVSAVVPLLPGDLLFTGTPAGVGWARDPKVTLRPGDRLVTHAEVIGEMVTNFIASTI